MGELSKGKKIPIERKKLITSADGYLLYNNYSHTRWIGQRFMVSKASGGDRPGVLRVILLLLLGPAALTLGPGAQALYFLACE